MAIDLRHDRGCPLGEQRYFREKAPVRLDPDAWARTILLHALETEALHFPHRGAQKDVRRAEKAQLAVLEGLLPDDRSPLETSLMLERLLLFVDDGFTRDTGSFTDKLRARIQLAVRRRLREHHRRTARQSNDPRASRLAAEMALIEDRHVTRLEAYFDPTQGPSERWLLQEAAEVYAYESCLRAETDPGLKAIWDKLLHYEVGQLALAREAFAAERWRDPAEILPSKMPEPLVLSSPHPESPPRDRGVLVDKLAERLAFERRATRLYEWLLARCHAFQETTVSRALAVRKILREEEEHATILGDLLRAIGAESHPASYCVATETAGFFRILVDPREPLGDCVHALQTAELTDYAGWDVLLELANRFRVQLDRAHLERALAQEQQHVQTLRDWHEQLVFGAANVVDESSRQTG